VWSKKDQKGNEMFAEEVLIEAVSYKAFSYFSDFWQPLEERSFYMFIKYNMFMENHKDWA
jgi:hypothetical protein